MAQSKYHWKDGIYFERYPDGSVHIFSSKRDFEDMEIPPDEWSSIVAFLSIKGDNAITVDQAFKFHMER